VRCLEREQIKSLAKPIELGGGSGPNGCLLLYRSPARKIEETSVRAHCPQSFQTTPSMSIETNPPISAPDSSLLVRANEGRTLHAFGHAVVILLDGKQTGGKFTAFLNVTPPGGGPGPHYHEREDEWFYIEGRVSFLLNDTWTDLFPGDCVYSPRGSGPRFQEQYGSDDPRVHQYRSLGIRTILRRSSRVVGESRARHEPHGGD
jgi:mannose-6-phosphate isomerase-like protein (cupin superfamily)